MVWEQLLEKMIFFAPGTLVDPPLAPAVRGPGCPPAPPSDHWFRGSRASRWAILRLGNHKKWGVAGGLGAPRNRILSHVAQDRGPFLVSGCWCTLSRILGLFGAFFGPFLGHIVELKGTRGLFDTLKSSRTLSVATVSLHLGVLPGFGGYFGRKKAVFGPKLRRFGRAPPDLAPPPRGATGEFLAQNLDLARPPRRL